MDRTPDLLARLLDPAQVEEALGEAEILFVLEQSRATNDAWRVPAFNAIRKLHQRLATAKAEGAAEALEKICMDKSCGGHAYRAKIHLDGWTYYGLGVVEASVILAEAAAIRKDMKEGM